MEPPIGQFEAEEINERIARLLKDMGNPEPPIRLEDVRALQKLDLTYYSKSDLNLLDEIAHRTRLAGNTIATKATRMIDVVEQYGIRGMLMLQKDDKRIFIDKDVKQLKRRFIIAHEITHDLLDWHRSLLLGDNESTLSPICHQTMEAEANYGGRQLIFLGGRFRQEAQDHDFNWKTIQHFKKTYGNTLTTTLWQMVCERNPEQPVFGLISKHPFHADICPKAGHNNVAYFPRSHAFTKKFPNITEELAYEAVRCHAKPQRNGPVASGESIFCDNNGDQHVFEIFSFSNSYDLLTYGVYKRPNAMIYASAQPGSSCF